MMNVEDVLDAAKRAKIYQKSKERYQHNQNLIKRRKNILTTVQMQIDSIDKLNKKLDNMHDTASGVLMGNMTKLNNIKAALTTLLMMYREEATNLLNKEMG